MPIGSEEFVEGMEIEGKTAVSILPETRSQVRLQAKRSLISRQVALGFPVN